MPIISVMIKPASSNCNLRCKYCFYYSLAENNRQIPSYGMMDLDTLEIIVKKTLEYADNACTFAFQGGEPTLAGLDFYKKLVEYQTRYNYKKVRISNALQTNGMVIDDDWARFLAENRFLVGLSLDGPKDIHDFYRVKQGGKGSFLRVMEAVNHFNKFNVEYNILFVVTANTTRHTSKIYNFYKKQGFRFLQFVPCLDPLGEQPGEQQYSLTPERFSNFLKTLFDLWYEDVIKGNMMSIRYFDNIVGMAMGYRPEACGMSGVCSCQYIVEADGGVYPCDFYVIDEWRMGNLKTSSFESLRDSEAANMFIEVSKPVDPECMECKWYSLCRGGCRREREPFENGKPLLNRFCSAYKDFFNYAGDRIFELAKLFSQRR